MCNKLRYFILLQCVITTFTIGQSTPTISYISGEQVRNIHDQVDFVCSVNYVQDFPVMWVKYNEDNNTELLSMSSQLISRNPRVSIKCDAATPDITTCILYIKDIQTTDAGWYQCQVITSDSGNVTAEVELYVRRPPIISDNSTRSVLAQEGDSVELECYASGYPLPKISWRRENKVLLPTGGSIYSGNILKIEALHKEDRGTYYCVAENGVGKGARRTVNLELKFAPVVTVPRLRVGQALQDDADLECQVEAYPPPGVTWLKDGVQLHSNEHYRISHFATTDAFISTTIRVISIDELQFGLFTCRAQNKLGVAEGVMELYALNESTPAISHISQEQVRDIGDQVNLVCSINDAPDSIVTWVKGTEILFLNSIRIIGSPRFDLRVDNATSAAATYTLSIKDIETTDAGVYQCQVVTSGSGNVTANVELHVRRPPIISDNSTQSVVAREEESVQMECYASGDPPPKISWRRENNELLSTGGSTYRGNILKIDAVHKKDRGTYFCVAENGVGKGARISVHLEVETAPVVTVPRLRVGQALQYDAELECQVEGSPAPIITWLKDGVQLFNNKHYRISHFATTDAFTFTTIRVISIDERQFGLFTCRAQNKLGAAEGVIEVYETILPICPPACDQSRNITEGEPTSTVPSETS